MTHHRKSFLFLLAGFLFGGLLTNMVSYGQARVTASVDSASFTIGDHVRMLIEVDPKAEEVQVQWPSFQGQLEGLEWLDTGKIDTVNGAGGRLFRRELHFTAFDSGTYTIPAFPFQFHYPSKESEILYSDSFLLTVHTIDVDTTQPFKPIYDILPVESSIWDYWPLILVILIVLACFYAAYIIYKRRKKKKLAQDAPVSPEQAHEKALRLLQQLKKKNLWQSGQVKEYYAELSMILRGYLEDRFSVNALELTTDDLLRLAKKDNRLRPIRPELKHVLGVADLAKYAKAQPLPSEQTAAIDTAVAIIQKTKFNAEEEGIK